MYTEKSHLRIEENWVLIRVEMWLVHQQLKSHVSVQASAMF